MSNKKIIYLDASTLKDSACWRKLNWSNIKGLKPAGQTLHSTYKQAYGTAIHKALELYYGGQTSPKDCIKAALESYKPYQDDLVSGPFTAGDWEFRYDFNLIKTLESYFNLHPLGMDGIEPCLDSTGKAILEQKFCIPIWQNDRFEIALTGIIDMQIQYHKERAILDHKTHGLTSFDGKDPAKKYFRTYEMSVQMQTYTWVNKHGNGLSEYLPVIINALFLKKPTQKAEKAGVYDGATFERDIKRYDDAMMRQYENWLERKLGKLVGILNMSEPDDEFIKDYELSACQGGFGLCKFYDICKHGDIDLMKGLIKAGYVETEYNPLSWRD